jgi:hypothetical protein
VAKHFQESAGARVRIIGFPNQYNSSSGTTKITKLHERGEAGPCLDKPSGAAFSNPFTSELARDSENTSLTRSADGLLLYPLLVTRYLRSLGLRGTTKFPASKILVGSDQRKCSALLDGDIGLPECADGSAACRRR